MCANDRRVRGENDNFPTSFANTAKRRHSFIYTFCISHACVCELLSICRYAKLVFRLFVSVRNSNPIHSTQSATQPFRFYFIYFFSLSTLYNRISYVVCVRPE